VRKGKAAELPSRLPLIGKPFTNPLRTHDEGKAFKMLVI
jgi:hypothetical protein